MNLGKVIYITWRGLGVEIDDVKETTDELALYISVPKDTVAIRSTHVSGNKLVGALLAKRVKDTLIDMGAKRVTVKYKIRDEVWTDAKRQEAEEAAKKMLYGSQW